MTKKQSTTLHEHALDDALTMAQPSVKDGGSKNDLLEGGATTNTGAAQPQQATTWTAMFRAWPFCTFLIAANEFCMTLSGLGCLLFCFIPTPILTLYMLNKLRFSEQDTITVGTAQSVLVCLLSFFGSLLSDGYLGRYKTILYGSLLFCVGKVWLAGSSILPQASPSHPWIDIVGMVAIATAGSFIGPSTTPFCGDQFEPHQQRMLSFFFAVYFFMLHSGSLISTFVMPILRSKTCFGEDSCYALPFSVTAGTMLLATVFFVCGSRWYRKRAPVGNVLGRVADLICVAIANKFRSTTIGDKTPTRHHRRHWLEHYLDTHDCAEDRECVRRRERRRVESAGGGGCAPAMADDDKQQQHDWQRLELANRHECCCAKARLVRDLRSLFQMLVLFVPYCMFWTVSGQQGPLWLFQSLQMDCRVRVPLLGERLLLPDQMAIVSPIFSLFFIVLFEWCVYPLLRRVFKLTPFRRMVAGGVVAVLAFLVSVFLQMHVNSTIPDRPKHAEAFVAFVNTHNRCALEVADEAGASKLLPPNSSLVDDPVARRRELFRVHVADNSPSRRWSTRIVNCSSSSSASSSPFAFEFPLGAGQIHYAVFVADLSPAAPSPASFYAATAEPKKPTGGNGEFSLAIDLALAAAEPPYRGAVILCRHWRKSSATATPLPADKQHTAADECNPHAPEHFHVFRPGPTRLVRHSHTTPPPTTYEFKPVRSGIWRVYFDSSESFLMNASSNAAAERGTASNKSGTQFAASGVELEINGHGGVYVLLLTGNKRRPDAHVLQVVPENRVSVLWQLPQIAFSTASSILFSVAGLEFTYTQSAKWMKSLVYALYGLMNGVTGFFFVFVTLIHFDNMADQLLFYTALLAGCVSVFALLTIFYFDYRDPADVDDGRDDDDEVETGGGEQKFALRPRSMKPSSSSSSSFAAASELNDDDDANTATNSATKTAGRSLRLHPSDCSTSSSSVATTTTPDGEEGGGVATSITSPTAFEQCEKSR